MRRPLHVILTLLLLGPGLVGAIGRRRLPARPNVVLILTDDQGWGDLSANKNPWLTTPNIDRLARQGTSFEHFYVSPLCAPTRASLLTGVRAHAGQPAHRALPPGHGRGVGVERAGDNG